MNQTMCPQRDAASVIFNLPGYRVIQGLDLPLGGRRVVVEYEVLAGGCHSCGVISDRVHSWARQRVKDIPIAGAPRIEVVVRKPRLVCTESRCPRKTFTQATDQLPLRARCLTRLRHAVVDAVIGSGRAVVEVAAAHGLAWATVQACIDHAFTLLPRVEDTHVTRLGVDEHRYRSVRFYRDSPDSPWQRSDPWMTTFVNLDTGQVLGMVEGRDGHAVASWLTQRSTAWRERIEVVAIDPCRAFRKALTTALPHAQISIDPFHIVMQANLAVTKVRARTTRETHGRRGRGNDATWANRRILLHAEERFSARARARLEQTLTAESTGQLRAAHHIKETVRALLATTTACAAARQWIHLHAAVTAADLPETTRLCNTLTEWKPQLNTYLNTRVTNARSEASNTGIKHIKRTARGYTNTHNYQARILLTSARKTSRRRPSTPQGTTPNRE